MAGIEFTFETEKKAEEFFQYLTGIHGRQLVRLVASKKAVQVFTRAPHAMIDWLIQYEHFDPTKDSYLIHE